MPMLITNIYDLPLTMAMLVVIAGLIPMVAKSTRAATCGEVVGHSLGVPAFFAMLYLIVPRYKKDLADLDVELPDVTKNLMMLSDTFIAYWYLFVPPLVAVLVFDAVKFNAWHRKEETRTQALVMSAIMTALVAGMFLWSAFAVVEAMARID